MTIQEKVSHAQKLNNQIEVLNERVEILNQALEGTKKLSVAIYSDGGLLFTKHAWGGQGYTKYPPNGGENEFSMPDHYVKFLNEELEFRTKELNELTAELEGLFK